MSQLLLLSVVALVVPILVMIAIEALQLAGRERARTTRQAADLTQQIAAELDQTLTNYLTVLQTLATSPALDDSDFAGLYAQAAAALKPYGLHAFLQDRSGQQLFNTRTPLGAALPKSAVPAEAEFAQQRHIVTDVVIGAVAQRPVVGLAVPVMEEGQLKYVLSLSLDADLFRDLLVRQGLPDQWRSSILDVQGVIVARSHRHDDYVMKRAGDMPAAGLLPVAQQGLNLEGEEMTRSYAVSKLSGWRVRVSAPVALADAAVRQALLSYGLVVGAITFFGLAGAYLLGRAIVQPLDEAVRAARALGAGQPVHFTGSILREANAVGEALRQSAELRRESEQRILMLMREVNHRSKNMLAIVQAIARHTARQDPHTFVERFSERLVGLTASQDLLIESNWERVLLANLVRSQLAFFKDLIGTRISIDGPPVRVSPAAAQTLGMALHELATNAGKHGALSDARGTVSIRWQLSEDGEDKAFDMSWSEAGGPAVTAPERRGFGHTVMVRMVESALSGQVALTYEPAGAHWSVRAPASALTGIDDPAGTGAESAANTHERTGVA